MKVLFIGGTGVISSACSRLAIEKGMQLYLLNRGQQDEYRKISEAIQIVADVRNFEVTKKAIEPYHFDVVVDWISFTSKHIENSIELFKDKTSQFIFISSASAYQTPPDSLPITEKTKLSNPYWQYSRDKIACERLLQKAYHHHGFPYTIVRPSHTYDQTLIPMIGGYTAFHRLQNGLPVVLHGDGTSIWTLTYNEDFAVGLLGLFGKKEAINNDFHITSDEWLTWNQIYELFADELKVESKIVYIPSEVIAQYDQELGDGLLGDKSHSMIFDNSKIKSLVPDFNATTPFSSGAKKIVEWYGTNDGSSLFDAALNATIEKMIEDYNRE